MYNVTKNISINFNKKREINHNTTNLNNEMFLNYPHTYQCIEFNNKEDISILYQIYFLNI